MPKRRSARKRYCAPRSGAEGHGGVQHDEIVAGTMHFGKAQLHAAIMGRLVPEASAREALGSIQLACLAILAFSTHR